MGRKANKTRVILKLIVQEERVEDYLKYQSIEYEKRIDENKAIFEIKGTYEQVRSTALFLYSQFRFEDFIALDESGSAFLCW